MAAERRQDKNTSPVHRDLTGSGKSKPHCVAPVVFSCGIERILLKKELNHAVIWKILQRDGRTWETIAVGGSSSSILRVYPVQRHAVLFLAHRSYCLALLRCYLPCFHLMPGQTDAVRRTASYPCNGSVTGSGGSLASRAF